MEESVTIFLDESYGPSKTALTMVCAVVFAELELSEKSLAMRYKQLAVEPHRWDSTKKFLRFRKDGFHYTTDTDQVRDLFLDDAAHLDFRAHLAYSANPFNLSNTDLLINLYRAILVPIFSRYSKCSVTLVFEQEQQMDSHYQALVDDIRGEFEREKRALPDVSVLRGTKRAPLLAISDYVMGVAASTVAAQPHNYHQVRLLGMARYIAHVLNLDSQEHSRRGKIYS